MSRSCSRVGDANAVACLPITPTFVLPYKRYAAPQILELAQRYLENDELTYRQAVRPGHLQITYQTAEPPVPNSPDEPPEQGPHLVENRDLGPGFSGDADPTQASLDADELPPDPILDHSTIWRWLTWLSGQVLALRIGLRLWFQHEPTDSLHRFDGAVDPDKYRSELRGEMLRTARILLRLRDRWDRNFDEKFFTRFATRGSDP